MDTMTYPAPNMLRATPELARNIQLTVSAYWLRLGPTESAYIIGDEDAGDYWHYRPSSWDDWNVDRVSETRLFGRIWDDAQAENAWRAAWDEAHEMNATWPWLEVTVTEESLPSGDLVITGGPVEDDAADRVARALGANEAQLAKLRQLVQDRRDAQRAAEELRSLVTALQLRAERAEADISDGGDPRLIPFWEDAASKAEDAGYCSEYDRMARMLNGVPRSREFEVEVRFTVTGRFTVTARNEDDAELYISDMTPREVWNMANVDLGYDIQDVEVNEVSERD